MIPSAFAKAFTALFASSISLLAEEFDIDDMTEMPLLSVTRSRTSIVCADETLEEASLISRKAFLPHVHQSLVALVESRCGVKPILSLGDSFQNLATVNRLLHGPRNQSLFELVSPTAQIPQIAVMAFSAERITAMSRRNCQNVIIFLPDPQLSTLLAKSFVLCTFLFNWLRAAVILS